MKTTLTEKVGFSEFSLFYNCVTEISNCKAVYLTNAIKPEIKVAENIFTFILFFNITFPNFYGIITN